MKTIKPLFIFTLLAAALCLGACSGNSELAEGPDNEPSSTTETDIVAIDGIYIDDSYVDEKNNQLKRVYLFYTLSPDEENLEADSKYTDLTINDTNTYTSEFYPGACDYMADYYYSSYIEDVYLGNELKVAAVFEIPEADLVPDRTITLEDSQIPTIADIRLNTNDVIHCSSVQEVTQLADPNGYQQALDLRTEADPATVERVRNAINGYYWTFFVNNFSYRTEFFAPNAFTTSVSGIVSSGTYTVTNGFVMLTNDSNGYVVEVPYSWEGDKISLDLPAGYSVSE